MRRIASSMTIGWIAVAAALSLPSGCAFLRTPDTNVPSVTVAAKSAANKKMVIVLPGAMDNLKSLQRSGIDAVIQRYMPEADVVLIALSMSYYLEGRGMERLHEQVVVPARQAGYREIYLAGASLGGMGVLKYESEHPGEMTGLILMSPYMGETSLVEEIKAAGGLSEWKPQSKPTELRFDGATPDEWRVVKSLSTNRTRASHVWLVCGQQDRYYGASQLIAEVLPPGNYIGLSGAHTWSVWTVGAGKVFEQIGHGYPRSAAVR